jgi:hypothetical protein
MRLGTEQRYAGVIGMELKQDNTRAGFVDDGCLAWPERIVEARRQWPQANPEDFEKVGKYRWRDKATGTEFRQASGAPLLSVGSDAVRDIVCFFVTEPGRLIFLERDIAPGLTVVHGEFYAAEVVNGQIVKKS